MVEAHHAIKAVAQLTGLSAHVIRVWEKRYGAVEPRRTATKRRLYSAAEIERLILLRDLTRAGHSIGQVATLSTEKLRRLAAEAAAGKGGASAEPSRRSTLDRSAPGLLEECLQAVSDLDAAALEERLKRGVLALGTQGMLQHLIAPLAHAIGELWRAGSITAAHEHFASAVIRSFLSQAAKPYLVTEGAPVLLVATPAGQIHELGALLVAAAAVNLGWHVTYLGASLPAAEIAGAARQNRARAVALSVVYPEDDPRMEAELARIQEALPAGVALLVGGRAADSYRATLERIDALHIKNLVHLGAALDDLRRVDKKAKR